MTTPPDWFVCQETPSLTTPSSDLRSHRFQLRRQDSQPKERKPHRSQATSTAPSTRCALYLEPRGSVSRPGRNSCYSGTRSAPTGAQAGGGGHGGAVPPGEQSLHEGPLTFPRSPSALPGARAVPTECPGQACPCPRLPVFAPVPVQVCWGGAWGPWSLATCSGALPVGSWDSRRWKPAAESGVHRAPTPPTPAAGTSTPPSLGSPSRGSRCSRQMERKPAALPSGHPSLASWSLASELPRTGGRTLVINSRRLPQGRVRLRTGREALEAGSWLLARRLHRSCCRRENGHLLSPRSLRRPVLSLLSTHAASWRKAQPRVAREGADWRVLPHPEMSRAAGGTMCPTPTPGACGALCLLSTVFLGRSQAAGASGGAGCLQR